MENPVPTMLTSIGLNMLVWIIDLPMKNFVLPLVIVSFISTMPAGCVPSSTSTALRIVFTPTSKSPAGAFKSGQYRNLFQEYLNKSDPEMQSRLGAAWEQLFYGDDDSDSNVAVDYIWFAADPEKGKPFVRALWDTPVPSGKWRYYDGMLYMLGLLQASGSFRIYTHQ